MIVGVAVSAEAQGGSEVGPGLLPVLIGLAAVSGVVLWRGRVFRLDRRPRGSIAEPVASGSSGLTLLAVACGVFVLPQLLGMGLASLLGVDPVRGDLRDQGLSSALVYALGIGMGVSALIALARAGVLHRTGDRPGAADLWRGVLGLALALPIVWLVGRVSVWLFRGGDDGPLQHGTLELLSAERGGGVWWWAVVAGAVIGAPVYEEVVFRGLVQPAVRGLTGSRWLAVVSSAGVFTLLHVPSGDGGGATLSAVPMIGVLALGLAVARERWGSVWPAVAMHVLFNGVNVGMALAGG